MRPETLELERLEELARPLVDGMRPYFSDPMCSSSIT
jgi:hypothetical protein